MTALAGVAAASRQQNYHSIVATDEDGSPLPTTPQIIPALRPAWCRNACDGE